MPKVIGVRFRTSPKMYYFSPLDGVECHKGDTVVVETQRGVEFATVIMSETEIDESKIVMPLKQIGRLATESDMEAARADDEKKQSILATAKEKVAARELKMKIVDCEFTVDHSKLVLYFTAEQRVDFRELVRDLASAFHMRIDLRQIGAREECKLIGSLGACGMPCCCGRFESDAEHVSIKMAKCQNLALTPNKINGMCGRLLCCLAYENKTYEEVQRRSPKIGSRVTLPDGRCGIAVSVAPLTEKVRVRVGNDESFEFTEASLAELRFDRQHFGPQEDVDADVMRPEYTERAPDMPTDADVPPETRFDRNRNKQKNKFGNRHGGNNQGFDRGNRPIDNAGTPHNNNRNNNNRSDGNNTDNGNKKKKHRFDKFNNRGRNNNNDVKGGNNNNDGNS